MNQRSENRILLAIASVGVVVAMGIAMLGSYAITQRSEVLRLQTQLESQQNLRADMGRDQWAVADR